MIVYSFNQNEVIEFDYDKAKMAKIMEEISELKNDPFYYINFTVKNEKECRKNVISKAYEDARDQAIAIAQVANKKIKGCVKVDFKPFTTNYLS